MVPLSRKAELQTLLDQHRIIRLEAGDYQKGNALASIQMKTGYGIYGLATSMPEIRLEAGTEDAVISSVHATIVFQGGSAAVTRHNLIRRTTYSAVKIANARVEDNLFLDLSWCSLDVDTRQAGWFRNNRLIRFGAQVEANPGNPVIRLRGDAARASGGNVFLSPTFLGTPANYADNQYSLTMIGFSEEGYSTAGDPALETGPMGLLTLWETSGLMKSGRPLITDADQAMLYGFELATYIEPTVVMGPHQKASLYLNHSVPPDRITYAAPGFRVTGMDAGGEIAKKLIVDGAAQPQAISGEQAGQLRSILMQDRGARWEAPGFAPIPDPAGSAWNQDLAAKPSSSAYIQGLIDKNGIALLPAGVYYLDKPIVLGRRSQGLIGAGMDSTVLIAKSPDLDMIVMDSIPQDSKDEPGLTLADLTLQGGRNGISQTWRGGKILQFYDGILSHVTFRDMREAGLRFSDIYAWDNDLIDDVNFLNCASGVKQITLKKDGVNDATPTLNYMDKVMFYHCRFQSCGKALDMVTGRACNDNWFVNCRFEDNSEYVWRSSHTPLFFVNCDAVNNGGSPVIHNDGHLYVIGSRFTAGQRKPGSFLNSFSNLSIAESEFAGTGTGTSILPARNPDFLSAALTNPDNRRHYENMRINFFNTVSDIPVGLYRNGLLCNNNFRQDPDLAREWAYMDTSRLTTLMPAQAVPKPQLLVGSAFPLELGSGPGAGVRPRNGSGRLAALRVIRNSDGVLELIMEGSAYGGAAPRLPDAVELYGLDGKRLGERRPAPQAAQAKIRFAALPVGTYLLRLRYGDATRIMRTMVR